MRRTPLRARRPGRASALALAAAAVLGSERADAGPPLVTDDPRTIGTGRVQTIGAVDLIRSGGSTSVAPTLDLTFGLLEGLDATLVANPLLEIDGGRTELSEVVEAGVKWRPIRANGWRASFTPALGASFEGRTRFTVTLPVQVEYEVRSDLLVGAEAGWIGIPHRANDWRTGSYAAWGLATRLTLLAEVWGTGTVTGEEAVAAAGAGCDWEFRPRLHLIASGGTGLASHGTSRIDGYGYAGVQWTFTAW